MTVRTVKERLRMTERSALVTGASRGIGFAIAKALVAEGYALTLVSRTGANLADAAERLAGHGVRIVTRPANVADDADLSAVVDLHQQEFGTLDVLVNNAGMGINAPLSVLDRRQVDLQIALNLRSVISLTRLAQPMLEKAALASGRALVVNVASISGKVGAPGLSVYAAAKHGVVGFTDSMNRELYSTGIRFTALCPGFVDTALSDYVKDQLKAADMVQPADLAEAVRFLLRLSPACLIPEMLFLEAASLGIVPTVGGQQ
ncbi:SDR family oxidoreductase [Dactylosporangium sp. CA-233914]|uniref:SDR family oxidoreductase n=1 Tax=Dactylosporangium sp. CA-233914 TaxID=3239934 RepID=UPI003D94C2A1